MQHVHVTVAATFSLKEEPTIIKYRHCEERSDTATIHWILACARTKNNGIKLNAFHVFSTFNLKEEPTIIKYRHCEERSDAAIHNKFVNSKTLWMASSLRDLP